VWHTPQVRLTPLQGEVVDENIDKEDLHENSGPGNTATEQ